MHQIIIVLIGCVGCGKDTIMKLLMMAYPGLIAVSTSEILGGGNSDGKMVRDDLGVHHKLLAKLHGMGFFDYDKSQRFIFNGAGRRPKQMELLINTLAEHGMLTEQVYFVKLNISSGVALLRMQMRYLNNMAAGTLRNDEVGDTVTVEKTFRERVLEWVRARDGVVGKPGIYAVMQKMLRGHKSRIVDINAEKSLAEVALDTVDELGLNRQAMIDTLIREGVDMKGVPGFKSDGKLKKGKKSEQSVSVAVQ